MKKLIHWYFKVWIFSLSIYILGKNKFSFHFKIEYGW